MTNRAAGESGAAGGSGASGGSGAAGPVENVEEDDEGSFGGRLLAALLTNRVVYSLEPESAGELVDSFESLASSQPLSEGQNVVDSAIAMLFGNESGDDDDNSILRDDEQSVHATSGASAAADAAMAWMMDNEGDSDESSQIRSVAAAGADSDGESVHAVSDAIAAAEAAMVLDEEDPEEDSGLPPPSHHAEQSSTAVDVVMTVLDNNSDKDSQPSLCSVAFY